MQARTEANLRRGPAWSRWLLCPLVLLGGALSGAEYPATPAIGTSAAASTAGTDPSVATPAHGGAPGPVTYRLLRLAGSNFGGGILNERNQVAFTLNSEGQTLAYFYDGRTFRPLGSLGGRFTFIGGVNDRGQVVGNSQLAGGGAVHAFLWSAARGMVDLGTSPGAVGSLAEDINNRGEIAGRNIFGDPGDPEPFYWSKRTGFINLGTVDGQPGNAWEINDAGQVRGGAVGPSAVFRWSQQTGMLVMTPPDGTVILDRDMNERGQIVGYSGLGGAFLWTPGMEFLQFGAFSNAAAINDRETVAGSFLVDENDAHAFVWTRPTGLVDIGTLGGNFSSANDVNNRDQVVGVAAAPGSFDWRAFRWTREEGMVDLNTRLRNVPPGLTLFYAGAINDNGAILAGATNGDAYLLLPGPGAREAPVTAPIAVTGKLRADSPLSFRLAYTDVDAGDTHRAEWDWGDGTLEVAKLAGARGQGSVSGQHAYRRPGIYTVKLTITDSAGLATTTARKVAVCGTGAELAATGHFHSPAGALKAHRTHAGAGAFAYIAPAHSAARPRGARVEVAVGTLDLRSNQVDAVSVTRSGGRYLGRGSVQGRPGYRFDLSLSYRAGSPGNGDRIRLRVWHTDPRTKAEVLDYDNDGGRETGAGRVLGAAVALPDGG